MQQDRCRLEFPNRANPHLGTCARSSHGLATRVRLDPRAVLAVVPAAQTGQARARLACELVSSASLELPSRYPRVCRMLISRRIAAGANDSAESSRWPLRASYPVRAQCEDLADRRGIWRSRRPHRYRLWRQASTRLRTKQRFQPRIDLRPGVSSGEVWKHREAALECETSSLQHLAHLHRLGGDRLVTGASLHGQE